METEGAEKKRLTKRRESSLLERLPAILEACKNSGVVTLKCGELEVNFASPGLIPVDLGVSAPYTLPNPSSPAPLASVPQQTELIDKEMLEEMRLSQLMIDDPEQFEQEIIDSHTRG